MEQGKNRPYGAKLFGKLAVFSDDMLRAEPSDLDQTFREHALGVWASFYMVGMFVIITSVEHRRWVDVFT